ncbi:MAG: alpha-glucosidase [Treponema phagedenis]|uniref:family 4 glycosyl hydrolase n=1 Tax=Treponema phagedenis TaxID=162 RepID=UPI003133CFED
MKIVLVGAGSAQFGYGSLGDIFSSKVLEKSEICLLDINEESLHEVLQNAQAFIEKHKLPFTVKATTDRKKAFKGADFIISSIEVGDRFKLWEEDWKVPLQYGIHQVYGENGGPGGVFHSLRIVPPILDIVKDAMEICPDAYIFNYSNPMTAICTTVKRAYPEAKFIGLCHEIGWLNSWLPPMLNIKIEDIYFKAAGLNHFSCMLEVKNKKTGKDLYPEVLEKAEAFFLHDPGYSDLLDKELAGKSGEEREGYEKATSSGKSRYEWADKRIVQFMLKNYKLLPITNDSHFGEYIGWAWDVVDHRGILDFFDFYKLSLRQNVPHEIQLKTSERVVPIIEGIIGDLNYEESAVNLLNNGAIKELPDWIAVEVPAMIHKGGLTPIELPDLQKGYASLLRSYCGVYDLTAEAIIHKKREYVIQAMLASPVVHHARCIEEMVDRMISRQREWLGYLQ